MLYHIYTIIVNSSRVLRTITFLIINHKIIIKYQLKYICASHMNKRLKKRVFSKLFPTSPKLRRN